jgi:hypothetical protein
MFKAIALVSMVIIFSGCQATTTKGDAFPKLYSEKPKSILVVPAINETTAADAAELYATTIAKPLAEAGYYVFSIPYVEAFLQNEGVVDGTQVRSLPTSTFKTVFGADAVLFVTIKQWDTNYYVTGGNVTVAAKFELVSTLTNDVIWQYDDIIVHNTSGNSGNIIADIISTAITTALVDYVPVANVVNQRIVSSLPVGQYHNNYGKDQLDKGIITSKTVR